MSSAVPKVLLLMGSESDRAIMEQAVQILEEQNVEVETVVSSAHRDPVRTPGLRQAQAERSECPFPRSW